MREQSRILITAPKSGSGKTTVTCGILAALKALKKIPVDVLVEKRYEKIRAYGNFYS